MPYNLAILNKIGFGANKTSLSHELISNSVLHKISLCLALKGKQNTYIYKCTGTELSCYLVRSTFPNCSLWTEYAEPLHTAA